MILAQHELLSARGTRIKHLNLIIIQLRCMQFGGKPEKITGRIGQSEFL